MVFLSEWHNFIFQKFTKFCIIYFICKICRFFLYKINNRAKMFICYFFTGFCTNKS